MMNDDNAFKGDNPFAKLNPKVFPDARTDPEVRRAQALEAIRKDIPEIFPDDDTALFLHAVGTTTRTDSLKASRSAMGTAGADRNGTPFGSALPLSGKKNVRTPAARPAPAPADKPALSETARPALPETFAELFAGTPAGQNERRGPTSRREAVRETSRAAVTRAADTARRQEAEAPADEAELFGDAMRDVAPLAGKGRDIPQDVPPQPVTSPATSNPLQEFMDGKVEFALACTDEYVEGHVVGLDLSIVGKLQNGQFSPEAHLDLHGLNSEQAFEMLVGFMRGSYLGGRRTVLVVPGRGRNSPAGIGVLREKVQAWFTQEPFKRVILAFCTAKPADGGPGALYVLLRRQRKDKGKVRWDRRPTDPDLCL